MSIRILLNGAVRIVAALSALVFSLLVLMGGAFASDAGTLRADLMALAVFGVGGGISLWVLLCSISPVSIAAGLPARPVLRWLLVRLPLYAAALAGVAAFIWATTGS
jgi:hypothetical protein